MVDDLVYALIYVLEYIGRQGNRVDGWKTYINHTDWNPKHENWNWKVSIRWKLYVFVQRMKTNETRWNYDNCRSDLMRVTRNPSWKTLKWGEFNLSLNRKDYTEVSLLIGSFCLCCYHHVSKVMSKGKERLCPPYHQEWLQNFYQLLKKFILHSNQDNQWPGKHQNSFKQKNQHPR